MFDTTKKYRLSIRDQLRMSDVIRWQIVRTDRKQNVAEHTTNVLLIAMSILELWFEFRQKDPDETAVTNQERMQMVASLSLGCLYHDLPEVVLGDIPTPMKAAMSDEARANLRAIENSFEPSISLPPMHQAILKAADLIDACHFLGTQPQRPHLTSISDRLKHDLIHLAKGMPMLLHSATMQVARDALEGEETYLEGLV